MTEVSKIQTDTMQELKKVVDSLLTAVSGMLKGSSVSHSQCPGQRTAEG